MGDQRRVEATALEREVHVVQVTEGQPVIADEGDHVEKEGSTSISTGRWRVAS